MMGHEMPKAWASRGMPPTRRSSHVEAPASTAMITRAARRADCWRNSANSRRMIAVRAAMSSMRADFQSMGEEAGMGWGEPIGWSPVWKSGMMGL